VYTETSIDKNTLRGRFYEQTMVGQPAAGKKRFPSGIHESASQGTGGNTVDMVDLHHCRSVLWCLLSGSHNGIARDDLFSC
jgi:hypothetical protein